MFEHESKKNGRRTETLTIRVKALTTRDIERAIERIDRAFSDDEAEDALDAVAYLCVRAGARAMADEIVHGEREAEEYAEMRGDVDRMAVKTVLDRWLGDEGVDLEDLVRAVLREVLS